MSFVDCTTEPTDAPKIVGPRAVASHENLRTGKLFDRLNAFEAPLVRWVIVKSQRRSLHRICLTINRLGNRWLYLAAAIVTFGWRRFHEWRPVVTATGAVIISFAVYYMMKPSLGNLPPSDILLPSAATIGLGGLFVAIGLIGASWLYSLV